MMTRPLTTHPASPLLFTTGPSLVADFPIRPWTWHYAPMTGSDNENRPLTRLRAATAEREALGLRRTLLPRGPGQENKDQPGPLDLASNDYLGLYRHPGLAEAAADAAVRYGTGATGSRLVTGTTTLHSELERELAAFMRAPAALVYSSGYLANLAVITALAAALRDVLIVSDELNHASLIDACRLARRPTVELTVTPNRDVAAVRKALSARTHEYSIVVTDAIFSVGGELAPLAELHAAAAEHDAVLVIDEAHSFGVLGDRGRGAAEEAGVAGDSRTVRSVTLSKSLAGQGGAVLGHDVVVETLIDTSRGFIFDTGLAPPSAAAALAALRLLAADPGRGALARENTRRLAVMARAAGLHATTPEAAVVSVIIGDPMVAVRARDIAAEHGVHVGCFRPPSVPRGQACLRLTGKSTLTENDLAVVSRALTAIGDYCRITAQAGRKTP
jgi:8-amino-7-oxononanoate synthase